MSYLTIGAWRDSLREQIQTMQDTLAALANVPAHELCRQPAPDKWSVAQVIAHLNSYNRYYLPEMERAIAGAVARHKRPANGYSPGWLGNYFVTSMYSRVATSGKVTNKMRSPKDHRPATVPDAIQQLMEFATGQQRLCQLITEASYMNVQQIRIPISIARWIKISLGDTARFLVAHQVRHFLQVANTLQALGIALPSQQPFAVAVSDD